MQFLHPKSASEARRLLQSSVEKLPAEEVALEDSCGRVTAEPIVSPESLPGFDRAVVDGFAVRAADTFGAAPGQPAYLRLCGEVLMGRSASRPLPPGETQRIATGGMLPEGGDAVVMVEHATVVEDGLVEVVRAAAPGAGMVRAGEDVREGASILPAGHRLRPQDLGALAAAGVTSLRVHRVPRVAVLPTGDELVPYSEAPGPGQVRDVNSVALAAAVSTWGAFPVTHPIVPDDPEALAAGVRQGLESADLVLVAGGSSVGARDFTLEVLMALPEARLLLHGVAIRPGKPVIAVHAMGRLLVGLPGNPLSALIVFHQLVEPALAAMAGQEPPRVERTRVPARMAQSVSSDPGREDYVRVRLAVSASGVSAEPLQGPSSLLMTLVEAEGLVVVPAGVEGLERGESVEVQLF